MVEFRIKEVPAAELLDAYKPDEIWGHCANCGNHGSVWSCPPHAFDPAGFLYEYAYAYVLIGEVSLKGFESMEDSIPFYYDQRRKVNRAVLKLEATVPDPQVPKAVVVLSDGETTIGRPDSEAAAVAVEAGVPVYAISFGTRSGTIDFRGERIAVPVAPEPLARVAETTGGQFFETASEADLSQILSRIGSEIAFETEERDVTDWFAAGGLGLVALAIAGSIRWFGRII